LLLAYLVDFQRSNVERNAVIGGANLPEGGKHCVGLRIALAEYIGARLRTPHGLDLLRRIVGADERPNWLQRPESLTGTQWTG
jgi:hypothetical protein